MHQDDLLDWHAAVPPSPRTLEGRYIRLEPLDPKRHGDDLWQALQGPESDPALWNYLPYGPFDQRADFDTWLAGNAETRDPLFYSVVDRRSGQVQGLLSFLSIVPEHGSIEIGHVAFGARMQRSPRATEAVFLLAEEAFALGNRRLEWKCNAANQRSMRAAERFGFQFEGIFRQHRVVKRRNRDTAWFAMVDHEWPALREAFRRWLAEENFDTEGHQRQRLEALRG